jgi:hypothetical protein
MLEFLGERSPRETLVGRLAGRGDGWLAVQMGIGSPIKWPSCFLLSVGLCSPLGSEFQVPEVCINFSISQLDFRFPVFRRIWLQIGLFFCVLNLRKQIAPLDSSCDWDSSSTLTQASLCERDGWLAVGTAGQPSTWGIESPGFSQLFTSSLVAFLSSLIPNLLLLHHSSLYSPYFPVFCSSTNILQNIVK